MSAGCSLQAAAHYVACAPNTIRREADRNPDFGRRFREARLQAQLSPLQAMRKAAASHWRAAAWMLERGDPDHFARRPSPAFRAKQAQALRNDILAILSAEIDNPYPAQPRPQADPAADAVFDRWRGAGRANQPRPASRPCV